MRDAIQFENFTLFMFYFNFMLIIAGGMCLHHMYKSGIVYSQTFQVVQRNFIKHVNVCLGRNRWVYRIAMFGGFELLAFVVECPSVAPSSNDRQYVCICAMCFRCAAERYSHLPYTAIMPEMSYTKNSHLAFEMLYVCQNQLIQNIHFSFRCVPM